eukprot:8647029-Pyramimonas_sp.AAC.1
MSFFADGICDFIAEDRSTIETVRPLCETGGSPLTGVSEISCEVDCEAAFDDFFSACGYSDPTGPYESFTTPIPEGEEMTTGGRRPINHTACCHTGEDSDHWAALAARCHCKLFYKYQHKLVEVRSRGPSPLRNSVKGVTGEYGFGTSSVHRKGFKSRDKTGRNKGVVRTGWGLARLGRDTALTGGP